VETQRKFGFAPQNQAFYIAVNIVPPNSTFSGINKVSKGFDERPLIVRVHGHKARPRPT
jgi:hypothetical protein